MVCCILSQDLYSCQFIYIETVVVQNAKCWNKDSEMPTMFLGIRKNNETTNGEKCAG